MHRRGIAPSLALVAKPAAVTPAAVTLPLLAPSPAQAATPLRTLAPGAATASVGFQVTRPAGDPSLPAGYTCTSP